jgi:hypothetical protein
MYLPGVPISASTTFGEFISANRDTWQADADALVEAITTAGYPPVLLHGHADDAPTAISSLVVETVLATQRRRLRSH